MLENIIKVIIALVVTNIAFSTMLFTWVTDNDFTGLRKNGPDRFADLFYFSIVSFSTAGYGDISPKSTLAKMIVSLFLLFVNVTAIYGIYNALASPGPPAII